jgi:hypothetical protein
MMFDLSKPQCTMLVAVKQLPLLQAIIMSGGKADVPLVSYPFSSNSTLQIVSFSRCLWQKVLAYVLSLSIFTELSSSLYI